MIASVTPVTTHLNTAPMPEPTTTKKLTFELDKLQRQFKVSRGKFQWELDRYLLPLSETTF